MTVQGKVRECARNVLRMSFEIRMNRAPKNVLYQMSYWGKAMRDHMFGIRTAGLEVRPGVLELVDRAEEVLKAECDGKDCSLKGYGYDEDGKEGGAFFQAAWR